jgi:hypothetical protein
LTWPTGIILLGFMYLMGHVIGSLSSLILENKLISCLFSKLYRIDGSIYNQRTSELFGTEYKLTNERILIGYCQSKYPTIYETAFVFLSIYGFSRNSAVATLLILLFGISTNSIDAKLIIVMASTALLLVHNYMRFRKYFKMQISSALLVK